MNTANKASDSREIVLDQADRNFADDLKRLQRYIRQHSVSAYSDGNEEMAEMVAEEIRSLGGKARSVPGVDFPIVYGRFDVGASRTVIIHGMYDTTPADPAEWISHPFEANRLEYGDLGDCILGRGAEDTKGPLSSVLSMIASHRAAGISLPVNLILLFEASELGSKSLGPFIEVHAGELKADVAYWPWHTQRLDGTAVAWLGAKGLLTFRFRIRGGDWGGPVGAEAHGLNGIYVANPLQRLAAAVASLTTPDGLDIVVDGFYDPVPPPTENDENLIRTLAKRIDPKMLLREVGAKRFKQATFLEALRTYCLKTDINVSGIAGGTVIESGHKVELPYEVVAALDTRPLDGMTVEHITQALQRHLKKNGFDEVEIEILNGYQGGSVPADNWAAKALVQTYKDSGHDPEIWPRTSAAIASHLFLETLSMPWIASTLGHAGHKHAPNEYIQVKGYRDAIGFIIRLMWQLADAPIPKR